MAFDYERIVYNTVIPQIKDKGTLIKSTRVNPASSLWEHTIDHTTYTEYWTNKNTGAVVYTQPSDSVEEVEKYGLLTDFTEEELRNTSIKTGDKKILSIELPKPQQGDTYTVKGIDYKYVHHVTIAPGDTDVLYKIQVRY